MRLLNLRRASRAIAGAEPGPEGNVTKLLVAEAGQRITELGMALAGSAPVVGQAPKLLRSYLGNRAMTIAGGTSEITRNTIAERILGLPRDPLLKYILVRCRPSISTPTCAASPASSPSRW